MRNSKADRLERVEPVLTLVGPAAIGAAAGGYGAVGRGLTLGGAIVLGWALWQLSMVAVVLWSVATAQGD